MKETNAYWIAVHQTLLHFSSIAMFINIHCIELQALRLLVEMQVPEVSPKVLE